jgi:hypothetical protein
MLPSTAVPAELLSAFACLPMFLQHLGALSNIELLLQCLRTYFSEQYRPGDNRVKIATLLHGLSSSGGDANVNSRSSSNSSLGSGNSTNVQLLADVIGSTGEAPCSRGLPGWCI